MSAVIFFLEALFEAFRVIAVGRIISAVSLAGVKIVCRVAEKTMNPSCKHKVDVQIAALAARTLAQIAKMSTREDGYISVSALQDVRSQLKDPLPSEILGRFCDEIPSGISECSIRGTSSTCYSTV